jgi:hypothetical protein
MHIAAGQSPIWGMAAFGCDSTQVALREAKSEKEKIS